VEGVHYYAVHGNDYQVLTAVAPRITLHAYDVKGNLVGTQSLTAITPLA
jgi:hypothetical protein